MKNLCQEFRLGKHQENYHLNANMKQSKHDRIFRYRGRVIEASRVCQTNAATLGAEMYINSAQSLNSEIFSLQLFNICNNIVGANIYQTMNCFMRSSGIG